MCLDNLNMTVPARFMTKARTKRGQEKIKIVVIELDMQLRYVLLSLV
jgi:hypothetical protein